MSHTGTHEVDTPRGPAWVHLDTPVERAPSALLVLGHGAGGGVDARDLVAVRDAAVAQGAAVARVTQPYRVAGRRAPAPAPHLDAAWVAVVGEVTGRPDLSGVPVVVGGRSSGARVACRTASDVGAAGVLALAFPLHPPGRPDKTRVSELATVEVPLLVVQGERDPFGTPGEFPSGVEVLTVGGADHGFTVGGADHGFTVGGAELDAAASRAASWAVRVASSRPV